MNKIRPPFFTINPKSYSYGAALMEVAEAAEEMAINYDIDIFLLPSI